MWPEIRYFSGEMHQNAIAPNFYVGTVWKVHSASATGFETKVLSGKNWKGNDRTAVKQKGGKGLREGKERFIDGKLRRKKIGDGGKERKDKKQREGYDFWIACTSTEA